MNRNKLIEEVEINGSRYVLVLTITIEPKVGDLPNLTVEIEVSGENDTMPDADREIIQRELIPYLIHKGHIPPDARQETALEFNKALPEDKRLTSLN